MNLYLITQDTEDGYDTYDSAVVSAKSSKEASTMHPQNVPYSEVSVTYIGKASKKYSKSMIILSSFNAG